MFIHLCGVIDRFFFVLFFNKCVNILSQFDTAIVSTYSTVFCGFVLHWFVVVGLSVCDIMLWELVE